MVGEGVITKKEALARINPETLEQLLHPTLDPSSKRSSYKRSSCITGAASGKVVFTADDAEKLASSGEDVILVRSETSPEDIHGMHAAKAILTARRNDKSCCCCC